MIEVQLIQYGAIGVICLFLMYQWNQERARNKELTDKIIELEVDNGRRQHKQPNTTK